MRIKELYIKNFGKFSDTHFYLSEGIHVFYGENEYGKSTIYAFIKAMLFGMERGRGRAAGKDEFTRYEPWENPNYYAGVLRFTCGGRSFCLERQFDRYAKHARLICEDDGEELSVEDGDLEMLLGGMTRTAFENTAAIGRMTAKPGQDLAAELKNYAANYCETGGGVVDLQGALETLKERRKSLDRSLREYREAKNREIEKLQVQSRYVESDIEKRKAELEEKKNDLKKYQEKQKDIFAERLEPVEKAGKDKKEYLLLLGTVLVSIGAAGAAGGRSVFSILPIVVGILLIGIALYRKWGRSTPASHQEAERNIEDYFRIGDPPDERVRQLGWECQRIWEEWREKQIQLSNIREQIEEMQQKDDKCRKLECEIQAVELAGQRLKSTAEAMTKEFGGRLNREASSILSVITDGKYSRLLIDEQLEMSVYSQGRKIPVERLSRGTLEQIYFSLRMASLDILYEEEIPVILDDAFAFYDEKRLESVLKWLSEQSRQVIIFTCQRREKEILRIF